MAIEPKSLVVELLCFTKASPWPDSDVPVLYSGQRIELWLTDYSDDGSYMAGIHDGDLPVGENAENVKVTVAVSVPDGHSDRFSIGGKGQLRAAQFPLAKFVIQSAKSGYWCDNDI